MSKLSHRLQAVLPQRLAGMRRGVEKESLRTDAAGHLSLSPHPLALGSALTHPSITTDFSESQLELITGAHTSVEATAAELLQIHQFVVRHIGSDRLWVNSMPCGLPADDEIPIGRYGSSNVGLAKSIYRTGLGHRYGRRMQTISGIHYNWSMPGLTNDEYLGLIRNLRRHSFLLLYLFGASPAVCESFVAGRPHELVPLGAHTLGMPHATSLRMGRLGYQSDAQSGIAVSYNDLEGYCASLERALTLPYAPYEALGVRDADGHYLQLGTSLLQIENEFYGTVRPKRSIRPGERPLHALRERGIEYVEVRCMDLDPFEPLGIAAPTMRMLDIFLLHCLLAESPPDSPQETAAMARNQHRTASHGREPGLRLERDGGEVTLTAWGSELVEACQPLAAALDEVHGGHEHAQALELAALRLIDSGATPSARVLATAASDHGSSFVAFARASAERTHSALQQMPLSAELQAHFEQLARQSIADQAAREAADDLPFEAYRQAYLSPLQLRP